MGYILPMRPLQYDTYHQRILGNKQPSILLEKPLAIKHTVNFKQDKTSYYTRKSSKTISQIEKFNKDKQMEIFSEITGKGFYVNEMI